MAKEILRRDPEAAEKAASAHIVRLEMGQGCESAPKWDPY